MKRGSKVFLSAIALSASLAAFGKYPAATRGVYYGMPDPKDPGTKTGVVHYMSVQDGNPPTVALWTWAFDPSDAQHGWDLNWDGHPIATQPLEKNAKWLDPNENDHGQGVCVLENVLYHFAVLLDPSGSPALYITRYDMDQKEFLTYKNMGYQKYPVCRYPDGTVRGGGVAAAVLNSTIYVFTDSQTLSSTDGTDWATSAGLVDGYIPMDAVAFYPENAPGQIALVYKSFDMSNGVYGLSWGGPSAGPPRTFTICGDAQARCAALITGTENPFHGDSVTYNHAGSTSSPCLQLFFLQEEQSGEKHYGIRRAEFAINSGTWTLDSKWYSPVNDPKCPIDRIRVSPWYETVLAPPDGPETQRQYISLSFYECTAEACIFHDHQYWAFASDYLVAQNQDPSPNGYGWAGMPNPKTDLTSDNSRYWTLAGVVLGPPPYALNGMSELEVRGASNVVYGQGLQHSVAHNQTWDTSMMFSSGTQVSCGLGKKASVKDEFDIGYKHAWESRHEDKTVLTSNLQYTFGAANESEPDFGTHGWGILLTPVLVTQEFRAYAYDYDVSTSQGSYLGQDLITVSTGQMLVQTAKFNLEDPGVGEVPGLMDGTTARASSLDLKEWSKYTWDDTDHFSVLVGPGAVSVVKLGTKTDQIFSQSNQTVSASGQTSDIDIKDSVCVSAKMDLVGIKETLTAGYDSHYSMETQTETEVTQDIEIAYDLPDPGAGCTGPDCVKTLWVQPYLLQATDNEAPWVPTGYDHQLPWCMTWQVTKYETVGGEVVGASPPPDGAGGTVTGSVQVFAGACAEARRVHASNYSILGGKMAWREDDGSMTPIPMKAGDFKKRLGASVTINGRVFPADGSRGKWHRDGKVWTYRTGKSVQNDRVILKLDFGKATWDFMVDNADLADVFKAADAHARVSMAVNGRYTFLCDLRHQVEVQWDLVVPPTLPEGLEVTKYTGTYDSSTGEGAVDLAGDLPQTLGSFGDMSLVINGERRDVPLLSLPDFNASMAGGGELVYEEAGTRVAVDFGEKTWTARFEGEGFHRLMAPRGGNARLEVKLGGATAYEANHPVVAYTDRLMFQP